MNDLREHLVGRGLAERSIVEYEKWIRRAERWCWAQKLNLDELTPSQVRAWSETTPDSWSSRKVARAALGHYYAAIGRADSPHEAIRVPRKPGMTSKALSPDQASKLHDAALLIGGQKGLATLCGLYLGARRGEIAGLRWDGYDGVRFTWEREKSHDTHTLKVARPLGEALDAARPDAWSEWLFPGHGSPHVRPNTIWSWVVEVGRIAGVPVATHQLRHTAITKILRATKDVHAAMRFAGHRDPTVTMGYAHLEQDVLDAAVDALAY